MKKIYESNWHFTLKWLEDAARILSVNGTSYKTGDNGPIDQIYKAITAIHHIEKIEPSKNVPESDHFHVGKQWVDFAYSELTEFNARGDEYICSTTEALIKCNSIKRLFDGFTTPLYFRGEHNFGWELIPKLGRNNSIDWTKEDPQKATELELGLVKEFQERVKSDSALITRIFGQSPIIEDNNIRFPWFCFKKRLIIFLLMIIVEPNWLFKFSFKLFCLSFSNFTPQSFVFG